MAVELGLVVVPETETIFTHEELSDYTDQIRAREAHHIDITCGCTRLRRGDSLGLFRIKDDGTIFVECHCLEQCSQVFDSPVEFVKHVTGTSNVPYWQKMVWVLNQNGVKIQITNTSLLRYYNLGY